MPRMYELRPYARSDLFCEFTDRKILFSSGILGQLISIIFSGKVVFVNCWSPENGVCQTVQKLGKKVLFCAA